MIQVMIEAGEKTGFDGFEQENLSKKLKRSYLLNGALFLLVLILGLSLQSTDRNGAVYNVGYSIHGRVLANNTTDEPKSIGFVILDWIIILILLVLSGCFSGLTLGLMSLDKIGLEIVIGGDPESDDAMYAKKIQPIRAHGNLLLCTLLLGNTLVNSSLSVLLAAYTTGAVGVALATVLILIFGEILPQAGCSRHALYVGAHTIWLVRFFLFILYPVAKPISLVVNCIFKEEIGSIYSSSQLTKLVDIHVAHEKLGTEQAKMMTGAIDYADKLVQDVMTPKEKIFSLNIESKLDFSLIAEIFRSGHSRIPVYSGKPENVVGIVLTKDLIVIDPEESTSVKAVVHFFGRPVHWLFTDCPLSEALALFKSGRGHMAMVRKINNENENSDPYYETVGLITLEDIIEEIIQDEIVDETDLYVHVEDKQSKVNRAAFDFSRLRLLDSNRDTGLSEQEVDVVCSHLKCNQPNFYSVSNQALKELISRTPVSKFSNSENEKYLYKKGSSVEELTLILSGKVKILAGSEGFVSEAGPWSILGVQALQDGENLQSDFTAMVTSESLRCLRLSKPDLLKVFADSQNTAPQISFRTT
mmetsp:Transcript_9605/g.10940  ORF Transcript_9605/g.10940 Transcript_9605/m.10940 type:complete len:586 (+) Transcript_9605:191-1948(+)